MVYLKNIVRTLLVCFAFAQAPQINANIQKWYSFTWSKLIGVSCVGLIAAAYGFWQIYNRISNGSHDDSKKKSAFLPPTIDSLTQAVRGKRQDKPVTHTQIVLPELATIIQEFELGQIGQESRKFLLKKYPKDANEPTNNIDLEQLLKEQLTEFCNHIPEKPEFHLPKDRLALHQYKIVHYINQEMQKNIDNPRRRIAFEICKQVLLAAAPLIEKPAQPRNALPSGLPSPARGKLRPSLRQIAHEAKKNS